VDLESTMRTSKPVSVLVLVLGLGGTIEAHDPGLSRADVTLDARGATAEITFARRDVELLGPVEALGRELLELDGTASDAVTFEIDSTGEVHYSLRFPSIAPRELRLPVLTRLPRGHRQYVAVHDARGSIVVQGLLGAANPGLTLPDVGVVRVANARFLTLGIEHILTGWDHLLFLLALLLAGGGARRMLGIVTAFTAAHSVTLALAALEVVHVSPAIVEPMIAASIVWVGAENLLRRETRRRRAVAFAFGLVHGLGFASALADAGLGTHGLGATLGSLLTFNLGVEAGQLLVLTLAVPAAWAIARIPRLDVARATAAASVAVAACGVYWLLERTIL
jgi:hydrogenase/urease accessory protein HupE